MTTLSAQTIARTIALTDHVRLAAHDHTHPQWYKEWYHFCVVTPELELVLNLNLCHDTRPAARPGDKIARLIVLARQDTWQGDVENIPLRDVVLRRGQIDLSFGHNSIRFQDGEYWLSLALARRPVALTLRLKPVTYPLVRSKATIGAGRIDWVVVPRLLANGSVTIANQVYRLQQAPAYHDHNWGHWLWGQDFSWQWGFALPANVSSPWSCVFDSVTNRARTEIQELKFSVWKGNILHRLFMYDEIEVDQGGYFAPRQIPKFPGVMALVAPEYTADIPQWFSIKARRDHDHLQCRFEPRHMAQIIVPNETDLDSTIINEVSGDLRITASVRGESIAMEGQGFFEFLT
jgi:hypothetical protein